ncbi:CLUMA_CG019241, isoform A [Clunio marinus]|uniref:CLUMA_CG019241, isoform A n=1 Tax=Clunio marinus TaxID=568069 RepID=A0A1J1J4Y7_9DIPT|nr:CLUMA_CG019241, isoform A [Clunio marinus]
MNHETKDLRITRTNETRRTYDSLTLICINLAEESTIELKEKQTTMMKEQEEVVNCNTFIDLANYSSANTAIINA